MTLDTAMPDSSNQTVKPAGAVTWKTILTLLAGILGTWFAAPHLHKAAVTPDTGAAKSGSITVSADLSPGQHITLTGKGANSEVMAIARATIALLGGDKPAPEPKPPNPPDPIPPAPAPTPIPIPFPTPQPVPTPPIPSPVPVPVPSGLAADVAAWARSIGRKDDALKLSQAVAAVAAQVAAGVLAGEAAILKAASAQIRAALGTVSLLHWKSFSDLYTARIAALQKSGTVKTDGDWAIVLNQTAAGLAEAAK